MKSNLIWFSPPAAGASLFLSESADIFPPKIPSAPLKSHITPEKWWLDWITIFPFKKKEMFPFFQSHLDFFRGLWESDSLPLPTSSSQKTKDGCGKTRAVPRVKAREVPPKPPCASPWSASLGLVGLKRDGSTDHEKWPCLERFWGVCTSQLFRVWKISHLKDPYPVFCVVNADEGAWFAFDWREYDVHSWKLGENAQQKRKWF